MGLADTTRSAIWRGVAPLYVLLMSFVVDVRNANLDAINNCPVITFDKTIFQGTHQIASGSNCVILRFLNSPVDFDHVKSSTFVTIFNVSVSPMLGVQDQEDTDWYGYSPDSPPKRQQSLSKFCSCSMCAALLDSEEAMANVSFSSVETQLWRSMNCLPAVSAQARHFHISAGGRLLIVAKKQTPYYAYRFSYKYIYEVACPPYDQYSNVQSGKGAQWCTGAVQSRDIADVEQQPMCISSQWQCDGFTDCADGSDENCCAPRYTRCSGRPGFPDKCVPRCNGISECREDGTELDCRMTDCPEPNLSCRVPIDDAYGTDQSLQGGYQCLPASRRCNGLAECAEALDELGCDPSNCGPENGTYLCESDISGRCIRQDFVCDGQPHCPNADDETFCPILSRRLNVVLCMSGLFSCASVLFVIAYFHRRYCMVRRNRGRHRRRRFDLMSPVEQAARYFMQMCGAPPSYSQIMQMGGPNNEIEQPGSSLGVPIDEAVARTGIASGTATVDVVGPPPPDREVSSGDDSSEAEYLSTLTFPGSMNRVSSSRVDPSSVQIHAPPIMLNPSGQRQNFQLQSRMDSEIVEYAECADDPGATAIENSQLSPGTSPPFVAMSSDLSTSPDVSTNNIEMTATSSVVTDESAASSCESQTHRRHSANIANS